MAANSDDQPLLELPLSVLVPRRISGDGPRRFGRSNTATSGVSAVSERVVSANSAEPKTPEAGLDSDGQNRTHLRLVIGYIFTAFLFNTLLLVPSATGFRLPLRMFPFAASLLLAAIPPRGLVRQHRLHPALGAAIVVLGIGLFGLLNQQTESTITAIASIAFYAAILAPIIWVGRLQLSQRGFVTIVLVLWSFNTLSSAVGVLQVMFPGKFTPATSQLVLQQQEMGSLDLKIQLADGETMDRPFGLTDQPGGVAANGLVAFIFGLGLLSTTKRAPMVLLYSAGMGAGLFVIYLCQVRVALVTCGICSIGYVALLSSRGEIKLVSRVLIALVIIISASTVAALAVGGAQVADRVLSLVAEDAGSVYYQNRGHFLEYTFTYALPEWPVGAGLGRYGMMAAYFSPDKGLGARSLWAEIQWTAWVYDGGWLMIIAYPTAIVLAVLATLRIAFDRKAGTLSVWGTILAAYNIGAVAITFSYCLFLSQSGLEFWLLNAAIYTAYQVQQRNKQAVVPAGFESAPEPWRPDANQVVVNRPSRTVFPLPSGSNRRELGVRSFPDAPASFDLHNRPT